jgi:hypothetical protein
MDWMVRGVLDPWIGLWSEQGGRAAQHFPLGTRICLTAMRDECRVFATRRRMILDG